MRCPPLQVQLVSRRVFLKAAGVWCLLAAGTGSLATLAGCGNNAASGNATSGNADAGTDAGSAAEDGNMGGSADGEGSASGSTAEGSASGGSTAGGQASGSSFEGSLASFTAQTLDGGSFSAQDIQAKDVTVINFWQTSCSPCIQEMPALAEFAAACPSNVQLITACFDAQGPSGRETARDILERAGFNGVTLVSWDADLTQLTNQIQYTPTTVFVGKDSQLVAPDIIGAASDITVAYTNSVNAALTAQGLPAMEAADV